MDYIRPLIVTDAVLVSSSVAETVPLYNAGTTYALGDEVRSDVTHLVYQSLQADNTGHALDDASWWLPKLATNRWRMFDSANETQTEDANEIEVVIDATGGTVDSYAFLNMDADEVQVVIESPIDGVIYDETFPLIDNSGVVDMLTYLTEPFKIRTDLTLLRLAIYPNTTTTVTWRKPGGTVKVGNFIPGLGAELGTTLLGLGLGLLDFSRKEKDAFGRTIIVERSFARRPRYPVLVANSRLDAIYNDLAKLRATPLVWIGDTRYGATITYGFMRDLSLAIEYFTHSMMTLEIEGLT